MEAQEEALAASAAQPATLALAVPAVAAAVAARQEALRERAIPTPSIK